jgi:probable HAF family extracellular repeat protein
MKSRFLMCFTAIALFVALSIPVSLAAQEQQQDKHQLRYKLIDLGTFGGPSAYLCNDPSNDGGPCRVLNNRGTVVGAADTSIPDPFCSNPDCFVAHAFQSQNGLMTDLGALPGVNNSFANWVSPRGLVAGFSQNGAIDPLLGVPEIDAVLWKDGEIVNLGTIEGGYESNAYAVNDGGQVAGAFLNTIPDPFSFFGLQLRAFLWRNGVMEDLGTLGTGTDAVAYFINERGQVAGNSFTNTTPNPNNGPYCPPNVPTQDPFLWENGKMTDLGTLGGNCGVPNALNNRGQVVGLSDTAGDVYYHAFLWPGKNNQMQDLGTLGGCCAIANWVNDSGAVVGGSYTLNDQGFHAFLWKQEVMTDLTKVSSECSMALGINFKSQVVGFTCFEADGGDAVLWDDGQEIDLNIFNHPGSGLQNLQLAYNINDRGEIDGLGVPPGCNDPFACGHVFVLVPCDDRHRDDEGCNEGRRTNEMPQADRARLKPFRQMSPPTLSQWAGRYRRPTFRTGSDRVANDPTGAATPSNLAEYGYCAVDTKNTLTGICIGAGTNFQCTDQYDKLQCPPGKKAITPTNFACGYKEVVRVDGARHCPVCGGRCGLGCGPGCACGKDGMCHRAHESLKELLWNPQPESALTNP